MSDMLKYIVDLLQHDTMLLHALLAIVSSMLFTQWVKFQYASWLTVERHKQVTRVIASAIAFLAYGLMDETGNVRNIIVIGLLCAWASPTAYWIAMKLLYHFFPSMESVLSGKPQEK